MKSDKLITNTYEELFSIENIYAGHLKSRASRRSKKPIIKFEISALGNIYELHKKLLNGTFRFGGYNTFIVYEPKRREIQNMRYCDRVIQHVICDNMLTPYFSDRVIYDNCVCQKGKGSHFALDRFENMIRKHINKHGAKGYFLKCDVLKFFASIPHDKLKSAICSRIVDTRIRKMIEGIIDGYHTSADFLQKYDIKPLCDGEKTGRGIPIGNQTSQIFGMFYLDPVDRLIKEHFRINAYSRYMDDFVLLHENLDYLRFVKDSISDLVARLGLKLNSKTQIFPIKNGVTYLGYRFCVTQDGKIIKTIKKQTKRRFRWRVKLIK
ncbi:MAG: RNA-directed DNA polymerase, partial [Clostridia bacterium]|nr:RNA-directed DNA polymerase [Clostridia bacterium]